MDTIIVTVKRADASQEFDLAVRTDVPVLQLSAFIAEGLKWNFDPHGLTVTFEVEATPPGRKLVAQETLFDAQVPDGARLTFHPVFSLATAPPAIPPAEIAGSQPVPKPASGTPVVGRRGLKIPAPADEPEVDHHDNSSGYVLKQIDKDE